MTPATGKGSLPVFVARDACAHGPIRDGESCASPYNGPLRVAPWAAVALAASALVRHAVRRDTRPVSVRCPSRHASLARPAFRFPARAVLRHRGAGGRSPRRRTSSRLPPEPLDDLGPDLGAMVLDILHSELAQLNAAIDQRIELNPNAASEPLKEREFVTAHLRADRRRPSRIDGGARAPLRHVCRAQRPLQARPMPSRSTRGSQRRFRCPT